MPLHAHLALDGSAAEKQRQSLKETRARATPVAANRDAAVQRSEPMVGEPGMRGRDRPWDPWDGREAEVGEKKFLIARKRQLTVVVHVSARAREWNGV